MRIAGIDSGKQRDSFAFVGIEIKDNKIYVLGVKTWIQRKYIEVENLIANIHDNKQFDYYVVEVNNTGEHVYEELKYRHKIPNVIPVFTSATIKDQTKIAMGKVMPKNQMVVLMARMFQNNQIRFPSKTNKHIEELKRQISNFAEHITEAGNVSYYAEGKEHDDTVMALMLAIFVGRHYIREQEGLKTSIKVESKKYGVTEKDLLGSGVPSGLESVSTEVYYPN
jgi:hypothetical protein